MKSFTLFSPDREKRESIFSVCVYIDISHTHIHTLYIGHVYL